ncbi:hypothetical protein GLYMA_05G135500v4 [Glycine max]|uniref:Uncharacterized protein n=1 Tax=Glycine max TaxID=3847 RepID=A0A0R0JUX6_SOYBN|nr:hypothetical protein GYH30_012563 [Glycine max]KRH58558.1 hypothetical protein GLYMA_05G135500v4 [Glycine max]
MFCSCGTTPILPVSATMQATKFNGSCNSSGEILVSVCETQSLVTFAGASSSTQELKSGGFGSSGLAGVLTT